MGAPREGDVTQTLRAAAAGDARASAELLPLLYGELRTLACARMAKTPPGNTLQPTALVHEAYLRLVGNDAPSWNSRGHFFAAAAQSMRQILVDQARRKARIKHGGGRARIDLDAAEPAIEPPTDDILALNEAVTRLEQDDPEKGQIVMLRYFAGLTEAETAAAMGVSPATIRRQCRFIKALLAVQLSDPAETS